MSDGANLGITAHRAIETILGDTPAPEGPEQTPEQVRERLDALPAICEGDGPWQQVDQGLIDEDAGYSLVADYVAKAYLTVSKSAPELLDDESGIWQAAKDQWEGFSDWLCFPSGFQVGFGLNLARYAAGRPTGSNAAIVEVET